MKGRIELLVSKISAGSISRTDLYVNEILVIGLTPGLRVITANCSFYDRFHVTAEETEGRFVYSIGGHSLDIPAFFLLRGKGFFDKLLQVQ